MLQLQCMTERECVLCEIERSGYVYRHAEHKMTAMLSPLILHPSVSVHFLFNEGDIPPVSAGE